METLYEIGVFAKDVNDFDWKTRLSHGFKNMKKRAHKLAKQNPNCEVLAQPYDKENDCAYGGTYSVTYRNGEYVVYNYL